MCGGRVDWTNRQRQVSGCRADVATSTRRCCSRQQHSATTTRRCVVMCPLKRNTPHFTSLKITHVMNAGADLGFYKGGCPIHLKGAPEVERRRRRGRWGLGRALCPLFQEFCVFLMSKWWVLCIPGDIYWHCSFQKRHPNQKGGGVSGQPGHPLDPPLDQR